MKHFYIAVACTKNGGIGKDGKIPWYLPPDLHYFKEMTTDTIDTSKKNAIIMGKNTWNSLPKKPLRGRKNIVLTTTTNAKDIEDIVLQGAGSGAGAETESEVEVYKSLDDAINYLGNDETIEKIFVIGGGRLYEEAINHPLCKCIFATIIENKTEFECDTFFPIEKMKSDTFYLYNERYGMLYKNICYSYVQYYKKF